RRGVVGLGAEHAPGDAQAAIAAATADALGKQAGGTAAQRADVRVVADVDAAGGAARASAPTHREGERADGACRGRDRERAGSPGVGDALRGDAVRVGAPGVDRSGALLHLDLAAVAAGAPRAADAEAEARLGRLRGHGHAGPSAAPTGALREDPARAR